MTADCDWSDDAAPHKAKFEIYVDGADIGRTTGLLGKTCGAHLSAYTEASLAQCGLIILRAVPPERASRRPKRLDAGLR